MTSNVTTCYATGARIEEERETSLPPKLSDWQWHHSAPVQLVKGNTTTGT